MLDTEVKRIVFSGPTVRSWGRVEIFQFCFSERRKLCLPSEVIDVLSAEILENGFGRIGRTVIYDNNLIVLM